MNIEAAKIKIIKVIAELQNEAILKQVLAFLSKFKQIDFMESNDNPKQDALLLARMPTPVAISLETLKNEQGYSMKKLNQAYARLDRSIWEGEDFDQLLKAI